MKRPRYKDLICPNCGSDSWMKREVTCAFANNKVQCDCGWSGVDYGSAPCLVDTRIRQVEKANGFVTPPPFDDLLTLIAAGVFSPEQLQALLSGTGGHIRIEGSGKDPKKGCLLQIDGWTIQLNAPPVPPLPGTLCGLPIVPEPSTTPFATHRKRMAKKTLTARLRR
jgi:hypothetical protein